MLCRHELTQPSKSTIKYYNQILYRIKLSVVVRKYTDHAGSFSIFLQSDKKYFDERFNGKRVATVNGEEFVFKVKNLICTSEGYGAVYCVESDAVIVDAGSKLMNIIPVDDSGSTKKNECKTINGGTLDNSFKSLAVRFLKSSEFDYDHPIVTTGGKATEMKQALESLGYCNVKVAEIDGVDSYMVNSVGLLLEFKDLFKEQFE